MGGVLEAASLDGPPVAERLRPVVAGAVDALQAWTLNAGGDAMRATLASHAKRLRAAQATADARASGRWALRTLEVLTWLPYAPAEAVPGLVAAVLASGGGGAL